MNKTKWPARAVLPIAVPGLKFVFITILITGMLFYFGWMGFGVFSLGVTLFVSWFFRDPERKIPGGDNEFASQIGRAHV